MALAVQQLGAAPGLEGLAQTLSRLGPVAALQAMAAQSGGRLELRPAEKARLAASDGVTTACTALRRRFNADGPKQL